jgi:egghead protein (zeste-white 4 protein)
MPAPVELLPAISTDSAMQPARWRPGVLCFSTVFVTYAVIAIRAVRGGGDAGFVSWYASVVWTLPVITSALGVVGGLLTAGRLSRGPSTTEPRGPVQDLLVVVVPTIAREDTCPALERVVQSFVEHLPGPFPRLRIDIVTEEECEAGQRIALIAAPHPEVRIVTIPRGYRTRRGARFKARANHYAHELRQAEGEARDDVWVLHMDDDTAVGADTAAALARFVVTQSVLRPDMLAEDMPRQDRLSQDAKHLVQGVLSYPRELAANRLLWLADAVRPACDISIFAATTGLGSPRAGLHGELLLVRASIEASIGWDFGPAAIVEDAQFALEFCARYPGRSEWFSGRSYGATPAVLPDFLRQRERWTWGLLRLVTDRAIPLRRRLLLLLEVSVWTSAPLQHPALILGLGLLSGDASTTPPSVFFVPILAFNLAFCVWLYWEGLKVNARSSLCPRRLWWEPPALVLLIPLFSLWEAIGVARGVAKFVRCRDTSFVVIAKPA